MNQRNRKNNGHSSTLGIAVIASVMLLNAVSGIVMDTDIVGLVIVVLFLGVAGVFAGTVYAKKKGLPNKSKAKPVDEKVSQYFKRDALQEDTVKCVHPRGREKYIHQLDVFLANGLIDKAEYRTLKTRYEKLNIPDNFH